VVVGARIVKEVTLIVVVVLVDLRNLILQLMVRTRRQKRRSRVVGVVALVASPIIHNLYKAGKLRIPKEKNVFQERNLSSHPDPTKFMHLHLPRPV